MRYLRAILLVIGTMSSAWADPAVSLLPTTSDAVPAGESPAAVDNGGALAAETGSPEFLRALAQLERQGKGYVQRYGRDKASWMLLKAAHRNPAIRSAELNGNALSVISRAGTRGVVLLESPAGSWSGMAVISDVVPVRVGRKPRRRSLVEQARDMEGGVELIRQATRPDGSVDADYLRDLIQARKQDMSGRPAR